MRWVVPSNAPLPHGARRAGRCGPADLDQGGMIFEWAYDGTGVCYILEKTIVTPQNGEEPGNVILSLWPGLPST
jgi:hypothetical protein